VSNFVLKKIVSLLASGVYSVLYMYLYNNKSYERCWSKMSSRLKIHHDLVHLSSRPVCNLIDYLGSVCISLYEAVPANLILLSEEIVSPVDFEFVGWDFGSDYDPTHPWLTCYCGTSYNSFMMLTVARQVYRLPDRTNVEEDVPELVPEPEPDFPVEEFGLVLPDLDAYRERIRQGLPYDVGYARILGLLEFDSDEEDYNRDSDRGQSDHEEDREDYT